MSNSLKVSAAGLEEIVEHEGEILRVYEDPIGLPTLGVGHLLTPSENRAMPVGTKITKAESRAYLRKDLARFERCVNESVTVKINQNQFDALVSLAFNIGEANFEKSSVLRLTNRRNFADAADAFLRWNRARKNGVLTVLPGLTTRRKKERAQFLKTPQPSTDSVEVSRPTTQPAAVSGDAKDSASSVPASPTVPTDKEPAASGIGTIASTVADSATSWLQKMAGIEQGVSKVSFLSRLGRRGLTLLSLIAAFVYSNWEIFLIVLFIVAVVVWYLRIVRKPKSPGKIYGD